jgi:hypothetical protein
MTPYSGLFLYVTPTKRKDLPPHARSLAHMANRLSRLLLTLSPTAGYALFCGYQPVLESDGRVSSGKFTIHAHMHRPMVRLVVN